MRNFLNSIIFCLAAALPLMVASCSHSDPRTRALEDLRDEVENHIEELSAGDWIIIGPTPAMESAATVREASHLTVMASNVSTLRETLDLMESEGELSPRLWVCRELEKSSNRRTPGNARLRTHLKELLVGRTHFSVDERLITMQLKTLKPETKVLFIHTDTTLPHSSIGIELDYAGSSAVPTATGTPKTIYQHADFKP